VSGFFGTVQPAIGWGYGVGAAVVGGAIIGGKDRPRATLVGCRVNGPAAE
jgi:hypothetical protein